MRSTQPLHRATYVDIGYNFSRYYYNNKFRLPIERVLIALDLIKSGRQQGGIDGKCPWVVEVDKTIPLHELRLPNATKKREIGSNCMENFVQVVPQLYPLVPSVPAIQALSLSLEGSRLKLWQDGVYR